MTTFIKKEFTKKELKEIEEIIKRTKVTIVEEERILTPDQKVPHQFGYSSLVEPFGNRSRRYQ